MAPKSIFKRPGARHFQLVHRSLRDPLINDPDASQHVLKAVDRKGKSRSQLESELPPDVLAHDLERSNIGEATMYGVYYDDTEYDYMQHLRQVGLQEDGVESTLIEAPSIKKDRKGKNKETDIFRDIPEEALPSTIEIPRELISHEAIPAEIAGFQPDMDPHLRQTLEALEDDAFVDEGIEDDFFAQLVGDGERGEDEDEDFEFREEGIEDGEEEEVYDAAGEDQDENWEARFARFKKQQDSKKGEEEDTSEVLSDVRSEGGDTVGALPKLLVTGGKRRRKGASDASGYSMSSSSMFRNEGLTLLDERFDQIEKEYESDEEEELSDDNSDDAPELITSREDFNAIMDDFLDNYEILGGKMRPSLPGDTPADKLGFMRDTLREHVLNIRDEEEEEEEDDPEELPTDEKEEAWDCETILSTYSNLENRPRIISARTKANNTIKIKLDPKTGLPTVVAKSSEKKSEPSPTERSKPTHTTITRLKSESKEEKKARKQATKQERQTRRIEKKATKEQFAMERKNQVHANSNTEKGMKIL